MSFCPHCGTAVQPHDRFCAGCGKPAHASTTPSSPPATAGRRMLDPLFLAGVLTLMVALGGFVAMIFLLTHRTTDAVKRTPASPPVSSGELPQTRRGQPRVGDIIVGSGRADDGTLLRPGGPVPATTTDMLSADVSLVDHPEGGAVLVWIEDIASGRKTTTVSATIVGEGSMNLPLDVPVGDEKLAPGKYRIVVELDENTRFAKEFEVR